MIFWISLFEASSRPARESPDDRFPVRSKALEESPLSMSAAKEDGRRE
jgi:hypothetical protein